MKKVLRILKNIFIKTKEYILNMIKSGLLGLRTLLVYFVISAFVIVFFVNIGALSSSMSKMSKVGNPEDWLSFFGAVLGSIVAIIGAYILTFISNIAEKKEKTN